MTRFPPSPRCAGLGALTALLVALCARGSVAQGHVTGAIEGGFDSYVEHYTIADDDTLSSVQEFRSRLRLGYALGTLGKSYGLIEARGMLGQSSYEAGGHVLLAPRFGGTRRSGLDLEAELTRRGYRNPAEYESANGYLRALARGTARWRAGDAVVLRLDDRLESVGYDRRTDFDYDFTRNSLTASANLTPGFTHAFTAGVRFTTMSVPDSSQIEYRSFTPLAEYRAYVDAHRRVQVSAGAERRLYPGNGTRSSFWALLSSGSFEWAVHPRWSFEVSDALEDYRYDQNSDAYNSYFRNDAAVLLNFNSGRAQVGAGPAFGWLDSGTSPQDEYRELGLRVSFDWLGGNGMWVSASYEPGRRDYVQYNDSAAEAANADAVFSDYSYHRVDVFVTARVLRALWLNAYLDYQPEDHSRQGDDATATVASVYVSYSL